VDFRRDRDGYFDPLVAFVCGYSGTTLALEAQREGTVAKFMADDRVGFMAYVAKMVIVVEPSVVLDAVAHGKWIEILPYQELPLPKTLPEKVIRGTGRVHQLAAQALFVQYFDGIEDRANQHQKEGLVRFAKAIRNAGAHGGLFSKLDDRAPVQWRGLVLRAADNGKTLLDVEMNPGDLIVLMRELDDLLRDA
jgi:hypothetical protein